MRWASAISDNTDLEQAVQSCVTEVKAALEGAQPDVAFVFISNSFANDYLRLNELLSAALGNTLVVGCSAAGVIGAGHEIEYRHSLSMTVGELPGVTLMPFGIKDGALPSQDASPLEWETLMGVSRQDNPAFVILADPYSLRAEELLAGLDYAYPTSPKLGGLASGGQGPRLNALYLSGECYREGAVGVALTGDLVLDTVVAQGCRPIGSPMRITKCDDNLLEEVDGRSAITVMQELYERASDSDRALMSSSLFLGVVMDELKEDYKTGDFLIRNLLGVQRETGGLYIGAMLREHQTVQFHLRDAEAAREDLQAMLSQYVSGGTQAKPTGALLFSCVGRGEYLYGHPDHDTGLLRDYLGIVPLGGFFCNGEIGPVDNTTYLHGYTSSFALFRSRSS